MAVFFVARTVNATGRRSAQLNLYALSGVALILTCLAADAEKPNLTVTLLLCVVARIAIMGASCVTWLYTPEVYSAEKRATAHSVCFAVARIGVILCPLVVENGRMSLVGIGLVMFAVDILAACCLCVLPETYKEGSGEGERGGSGGGGEEEEEGGGGGGGRVSSEILASGTEADTREETTQLAPRAVQTHFEFQEVSL